MIPRNQNHIHMVRDLPDELRRQPILLVNISDLQIHFLSRIHSNPIHQIPANQNVLDSIGNMSLVRTTDLAPQPAQDPATSILHEHLTPDANIRYQNRIDLLPRAASQSVRDSPSAPRINSLSEESTHLLETATEVSEKIVKGPGRSQLASRIENHFKSRLPILGKPSSVSQPFNRDNWTSC